MWEIADILKISKSVKLLVKMKNESVVLWKKLKLSGQPNIYSNTIHNSRNLKTAQMSISRTMDK